MEGAAGRLRVARAVLDFAEGCWAAMTPRMSGRPAPPRC